MEPTAVGEADWEPEDIVGHVLRGRPDVALRLERAHTAAWRATDPVLLELCRLRIAMLLGCDADLRARTSTAVDAGLDEAVVGALAAWPTSPLFGACERACLAFCEHFVIDVATMSDDLVAAVRDELGPSGLVNFVAALLVVEQRVRLRLAWSELFGQEAAA